jgi:hypothetical protein
MFTLPNFTVRHRNNSHVQTSQTKMPVLREWCCFMLNRALPQLFILLLCSIDHAAAQTPLEALAPKAAAQLVSTNLFFAAPVQFSANIAEESNIPARELLLVYKFMGDEKVEVPYVPNQAGIRIPGYARKLDVEIVRVGNTTAKHGERTLLWKHTFEPQQTPPEFSVKNASVEAASDKGKPQKSGECTFTVKNIRVDFAKPVDVNGDRVITALVDDLQVAEPSIDASSTTLQFESAGKPDAALNASLQQSVLAKNCTSSGFFNEGIFLVTINIRNLPKTSLKGKILRGTLGIRLNVTLLNRRASRSATKEETVIVPIALAF